MREPPEDRSAFSLLPLGLALRLPVKLEDGGLDHLVRHRAALPLAGERESLIGNPVDQPRSPAGELVDLLLGPRREEEGVARAGDAETVAQVVRSLVGGEPGHVIPERDPLAELAEIGPAQRLAELGLADQDDLDQLFLFRFEVESIRICSSVSGERFWASSTITTAFPPADASARRNLFSSSISAFLDVDWAGRPKSALIAWSSSTVDRNEFRMRLVRTTAEPLDARRSSRSRRRRHSVVFPVPTSPVTTMKPFFSSIPYVRNDRASS